ncbi:hypothetical protein LIER_13809 [Lithospermum erythrorhizon]|uniref:Uncharacterized protein n=1 Tax=Lithospermum erythrorhizon TaxID=34254 RepID=A0AAV3PX84_LITER
MEPSKEFPNNLLLLELIMLMVQEPLFRGAVHFLAVVVALAGSCLSSVSSLVLFPGILRRLLCSLAAGETRIHNSMHGS